LIATTGSSRSSTSDELNGVRGGRPPVWRSSFYWQPRTSRVCLRAQKSPLTRGPPQHPQSTTRPPLGCPIALGREARPPSQIGGHPRYFWSHVCCSAETASPRRLPRVSLEADTGPTLVP
jgi:hypothetical protein